MILSIRQRSEQNGASAPALSIVSACADSSVWGLGRDGALYRLDDAGGVNAWTVMAAAASVQQLSAATASDVWAVTSDERTVRSRGTAWQPQVVPGALAAVSAAADGTVWGIGRDGDAFRFTGDDSSEWESVQCSTPLRRIAVGGAQLVFGLGSDGALLQYAGADQWTQLTPGGADIRDISAGADGMVWGVNDRDELFLYVGGSKSWYEIAADVAQVSAASASWVWALAPGGAPVELSPTSGGPILGEGSALPGGDSGRLQWDAEDPFDETRSTHLWIVRRAAMLAAQDSVVGGQVATLFRPQQPGKIGDGFRDSLCQGIYDADFVSPWDNRLVESNPSTRTWMSHFYDPDTGEDYLGRTDATALNWGRQLAQLALDSYLAQDPSNAGYRLGLALHYLTDLTQPMHAANYTYFSSVPFGWHTRFEQNVMAYQAAVSVPLPYRPLALPDFDSYYLAAASAAKPVFPDVCPDDARYWESDSYWQKVEPYVPPILQRSMTITSQFIVAWVSAAEDAEQPTNGGFLVCAGSGMAMDASHGGIQNRFAGSHAQRWAAYPVPAPYDEYHMIGPIVDQNLVLDVPTDPTAPRARVTLSPRATDIARLERQMWRLSVCPDGSFQITNKVSSFFLMPDSPRNRGSILVQQPPTDLPDQRWFFVDDWRPRTFVRVSSRMAVDVRHGSMSAGATVQQNGQNGNSNQQWVVVPVLSDDNEEFAIIVSVSSGLALDIGPQTPQGKIVQQPFNPAWRGQQWNVLLVPDMEPQVVRLENRMYPGYFIGVQGDSTKSETPLELQPTGSPAFQQWMVITNPAPASASETGLEGITRGP